MAGGAAKAASRTSPRYKQVRTGRDGVAQLIQDGSKTQKKTKNKRKKVNVAAGAANNKRAKTTNDPADGDKGEPVGDKTDAVDSVSTRNKKKRVAGAGKKRKSIKPKKAVLQKLIVDDLESTSESEEYVDVEAEDDDEVDEEEQDAAQDTSDEEDGQKEPANNNAEDKEQQDSSSSSSDENDGRERRRRYGRYQQEMDAEVAAMAEDRRKELNRGAQQGAADPPNNTNPNAMSSSQQMIDVGITVRGLSKAESMQKQEKHVANRVIQLVKSDIFRRIKFINNDSMFQKAFQLVMNHEKVEPYKRVSFQMLYESCFNHALNTKRSSCEQAGGALARKAITEFKLRGEAFYSIDEFCKLRRATTEREKNAFFWFFDTFMECVCGARQWRNAKKTTLVSKATDGRGGKLVTKSDEAFGLLLLDNYMEKWITVLADEEQARANALSENDATNDNTGGQAGQRNAKQKKKGGTKIPGKYTAKKNGHCKYGGWSRAGTARFNELYNLVQEDRASAQSEEMERELMAFCRAQAGIDDANAHQREGQRDTNAADGTEAVPVEAAWDLDD